MGTVKVGYHNYIQVDKWNTEDIIIRTQRETYSIENGNTTMKKRTRQRRTHTVSGKTETNKYNQVKGKTGGNSEISTSLINKVNTDIVYMCNWNPK